MFKLVQDAIDDILWPSVFVLFFWLSFFTNLAYDLNLNDWGIAPRTVKGLMGILAMPFLHGDFGHLFSNTIPLLVSGSFVFYFFKQMSWKILILIWLFSGFGVWLTGSFYSVHIGASGLVYGLVAFLLTSGIIRKNRNLAALALILIFMYGSMVWGVFPQISITDQNISWEGHLFGALTGIALAWFYKEEGPEDDLEPDDDEEMPQWWEDMQREEETKKNPPEDEINFKYTFRKKDDG